MFRTPGRYAPYLSSIFVVISAGGLFASTSAGAALVTDPANDFLSTYIGPHNLDMDARSSEVTLDTANATLTFTATVAGPVGGATAGGAWVWGLDRGKGTEQFLGATPPFGAGVKFDSVVALLANGTGSFVDIINGGAHTLPAGSVTVSGNTITGIVPLSLIPGAGFAPQNYTWNFWPESIPGQAPYVSDFAPDASNAALTVVPEPSTVFALALGLLAVAGRWSRNRRR